MKQLDSYFSTEEIIKLLCKIRIKYAKQRHKIHLIRDISLHEKTLQDFNEKYQCPSELTNLLPPRRKWIRLDEENRRKYVSSNDVNVESLRRTIMTVHHRVIDGNIEPPQWYVNLIDFINKIKENLESNNSIPIQKPEILAFKKENTATCRKFRPISQYSLIDRIVIGQTARYLTKVFDPILLDCAYAFRSAQKNSGTKTHHDTVDAILSYKCHHKNKDIYVAECDIKKFYDCVNHECIKRIFSSFVRKQKESSTIYDERASIIFNQYLDSYAFNHDVLPLNKCSYFTDLGYEFGEFEWPEDKLKEEFYGEAINKFRIGVPQGGALSCLISNLLLHNVDEVVLATNANREIEYLRYCDDMILLGVDIASCENALKRYATAIKDNFLLIHEPKDIEAYGKKFYNSEISKSKKPFLWASHNKSFLFSPWISFVGYQVRYDGVVRVRKKSIEKEVKKQEREVGHILKAIQFKDIENINSNSRKSLKQQVIALESRLIAMSVGRRKIYNYKTSEPSMCWANGFKSLSSHGPTRSQLKLLDSKRNRQLFIIKKRLAALVKSSENPDSKESTEKFRGSPFSYFGAFLNK